MKHPKLITYIVCLLICNGVHAQTASIQAKSTLVSVRGKVTTAGGMPVSSVTTFVAVNASPYDLRTATSDADGNVEFWLPRLPEKGQLVFQVDPRLRSDVAISAQKPQFRTTENSSPGFSYQFYDTSVFYGKPDNTYLLDDYTRFATMEEVFREFVSEVRISKQGNSFRLNVMDKPFKVFFNNEPLVLLDGVPVFDNNKLMEIDPLKIRSIDVVARKYYLGSLLCYGIVSLYSFERNMAGYNLPQNALVTDFTLP